MKTIGYERVRTVHQQLDSQLNALKRYGCHNIYTEFDSGRNIQKKELSKALNALEPGDTFVIFKLD
ncbi:transposon resolvase [Listeria innocua FSL J1-023]|nr:recombinase family protein [Listeria innocua]EFR94557.1 transposon resolvase [Listeria innocua FSL J1-023]OET36392.1 resolvase [Listeria monocytogenes]MBC6116433.1 recombinase family protein [Listeria innocua]MBC6136684.1 recombinase family protein [Listeria innocua]